MCFKKFCLQSFISERFFPKSKAAYDVTLLFKVTDERQGKLPSKPRKKKRFRKEFSSYM